MALPSPQLSRPVRHQPVEQTSPLKIIRVLRILCHLVQAALKIYSVGVLAAACVSVSEAHAQCTPPVSSTDCEISQVPMKFHVTEG